MAKKESAVVDRGFVVVDGSNIATEGRSTPSLAQLDEAVRQFQEQFPEVQVIVVVDATFGHRVDPSERAVFDEAVAHAEIVSPPAGAVGRGDAFLLRVAERVGAQVLSNDSFQEFHGEHPWLFREGRLIGGTPVPGVGWIFIPRSPIRGARSRAATEAVKGDNAGTSEKVVKEKKKAQEKDEKAQPQSAPQRASRPTKRATSSSPAKAGAVKGLRAVKVQEPAKKAAKVSKVAEPQQQAAKAPKRAHQAAKGERVAQVAKVEKVPGVGKVEKTRSVVKTGKAATTVKAVRTGKAAKDGKGAKAGKAPLAELEKVQKMAREHGRRRRRGHQATGTEVEAAIEVATEEVLVPADLVVAERSSGGGRRKRGGPPVAVNDPLTFLTFVTDHPIGARVEGAVSSFTSHGATVDVGDMHCYVPVAGLGDPAPRRAREVLERGERRVFVLVALDAPRRGAELALPELAG
ncbi:MAG: S1 RNA-binding domain-containing protein [Acidimicrobiales bacterium]|jgi:hypothetical protein